MQSTGYAGADALATIRLEESEIPLVVVKLRSELEILVDGRPPEDASAAWFAKFREDLDRAEEPLHALKWGAANGPVDLSLPASRWEEIAFLLIEEAADGLSGALDDDWRARARENRGEILLGFALLDRIAADTEEQR